MKKKKKMMQLIFPPIVINTLLYIAFAYFYLEYQFLCKIYFKEEGNMKNTKVA